MHPLDGAYERVKRARKHLADLKRRIKSISQEVGDAVVIERKPATRLLPDGREILVVLGSASVPFGPVPHIVSILVGEVVYNLRAALDYLVYELARLDAGHPVDGTQFLIEDTKKGFCGRRAGGLKGLSDVHVAALKRLQPCDGCKWTGVLRDISNPDKHRHLTAVMNSVVLPIAPGSTEAIIADQPVDVKLGLSVPITFINGAGAPVVETLQQLASEVAQTLDAFKPEFE